MPVKFCVIAHRGHQGLAPENTLDAFEYSIQRGFQHFETDVQLTADGVAIILHDEVLGRTVQGDCIGIVASAMLGMNFAQKNQSCSTHWSTQRKPVFLALQARDVLLTTVGTR